MAGRVKRRSPKHIMEEQSLARIRELFPSNWVVRDYNPDYGIDLAVEIFEETATDTGTYETLGEHVFVQLKSMEKVEISTLEVAERHNVEKSYDSPRHANEETFNLEVVRFSIDVPELLTALRMGTGQLILLHLVCLKSGRVFYLCLNDYVDKVLLPEGTEFMSQGKKTLYIPSSNEFTDSDSLSPIRFYAKRAKILSAFNKFWYQNIELQHEERRSIGSSYREVSDYFALARHFREVANHLDVWSAAALWVPLKQLREEMLALDLDPSALTDPAKWGELVWRVSSVWQRLANLSRIFEEICREWHLPTSLAIVTDSVAASTK